MKASSLSMEPKHGSCFLRTWADGPVSSSLHFKSPLTRITDNFFFFKLSSGRRNPIFLLTPDYAIAPHCSERCCHALKCACEYPKPIVTAITLMLETALTPCVPGADLCSCVLASCRVTELGCLLGHASNCLIKY